ncbi:MAG: peroxiredoxin [Dongiaceae bacterium]
MTLLVGKPAPNFTALALMPDNSVNTEFNLDQYITGKVGVLFFYALNFSYVCPTEIIALNNRMAEFQARGAHVVGVSVDSHLSHIWWKNLPVARGGIGQIQFPLVSDLTRRVAQGYDVLVNDSLCLRATFIIDKIGVVRYQAVHDLPIGRNIDEILRTIDALQHHEQTGYVCPANWSKGKEAVKPDVDGLAQFMNKNAGSL